MKHLISPLELPLKVLIIAVAVILLFGIFFGFFCYFLGLHIDFLQAESGLYLNAAFAPLNMQLDFISKIMREPYNGHFTPVVFLLEFLQSKVYGAHE